jgi:hypothetical protein
VPTITSVTFSTESAAGNPTPLVTINGSGFGNLPSPSPGGDPEAAFGDCGKPSGYDGLDFASHLYFNKLTSRGVRGRQRHLRKLHRPGHLGVHAHPEPIRLRQRYAGFNSPLHNGDHYSLHVKEASVSGTVATTP